MNKRLIGKEKEAIAVEFLKKLGYKIIDTNYYCRCGELDIIAEYKKTIVIAEVKYRKTTAYSLPQEAVDLKKQNKIIKTTQVYLLNKKMIDKNVRFDVIAVDKSNQCHHIKSAFQADFSII